MLVELRTFENKSYIEVYYKNTTENPPPGKLLPLLIPQCGYSCPLQKMYKLFSNVIPQNDFQTECTIVKKSKCLVQLKKNR